MKLETQEHIARNLRTLRTSRCMNQSEMARLIGITRSSYVNYELGKRVPDAEVLFNIATRFGISMDTLFETDRYVFLSLLEKSDLYEDELAELISSYRTLSAFAKGMLIERAAWLTEWDRLINSNKKAFAERYSERFSGRSNT
ncbi:MAG: helix-turn-helix domain-containing protein [Anaerovoracaceae bacterium]